eukprot:COSAG06_NODE_1638_length_8838_cov_4.151619_13_plen_87_part_01
MGAARAARGEQVTLALVGRIGWHCRLPVANLSSQSLLPASPSSPPPLPVAPAGAGEGAVFCCSCCSSVDEVSAMPTVLPDSNPDLVR